MKYDFAVLDSAEPPRSIVYEILTDAVVAVFGPDELGQKQAEAVSDLLNILENS